MYNLRSAQLLFSLLFITNTLGSTIEYDGWVNINLHHALVESENPVYTYRGNLTIQSLRTGSHVINQNSLSQEDRTKLRDLALRNNYYQLKSVVTASDGSETTFTSSVKACMLAESGLNDILSVSLDYTGKVITITEAISSTSTCEGASVSLDKLRDFVTSVYVRHPDNGPVPDTATYIQKLEREREAKERGEVKDNRSFLAKYWMYIVPVVILMVLSSATNPDAAGGAR